MMVAVCCWKGGWPPTRACSSCKEPVLFQAGRPGHFVDLEFKLASLTSTIEAIIVNKWTGICGGVYEAGETLSWRRGIKARPGPVWCTAY